MELSWSPESLYIGFTSGNEGYKIVMCMDGPEGPHCETVATAERDKHGTVESSATGGLRRLLPGMDMYDVSDPGVLSRCVLKILYVGDLYLRNCASESTLYERVGKEMTTLANASERITKKIDEEPENVKCYLGPILGNFNSKVFDAIIKQALMYPPEVRDTVMKMLGLGAKELESSDEKRGMEISVQ